MMICWFQRLQAIEYNNVMMVFSVICAVNLQERIPPLFVLRKGSCCHILCIKDTPVLLLIYKEFLGETWMPSFPS